MSIFKPGDLVKIDAKALIGSIKPDVVSESIIHVIIRNKYKVELIARELDLTGVVTYTNPASMYVTVLWPTGDESNCYYNIFQKFE